MDDIDKARLKEAVRYALSRSLPKVPKRGAWRGLEPTSIAIAADAVLAHLELCGYCIDKRPHDTTSTMYIMPPR